MVNRFKVCTVLEESYEDVDHDDVLEEEVYSLQEWSDEGTRNASIVFHFTGCDTTERRAHSQLLSQNSHSIRQHNVTSLVFVCFRGHSVQLTINFPGINFSKDHPIGLENHVFSQSPGWLLIGEEDGLP